jgi:transcriptional regulator with XRE-family HTH domain
MSPLNINEKFGKKLKEYRCKHQMSQYDLGKLLSYTQAEISKVENGKRDISMSKFVYINNLLKLIEFNF